MNLLKEVIRSKLISNVFKLLFKIFAMYLPGKKNLIVFESFSGKQYSDNPRAIFEYMRKHRSEFNLYWSVHKDSTEVFNENGIPYIKRYTLKWLLLMTRAEYWVSNSRLPLWVTKPKHTTYLQTWHGTPLKKLAHDMDEVYMPGTTTEKYKENFSKDVSNWDYLISPNPYSTEIFKRAFQFDKRILETGYPRNDFLVTHNQDEQILKIKEKLNLRKDKKVILYAPTWRDDYYFEKGRYRLDLQLDLDKLKAVLGEEYILILRMHYLVAENLPIEEYKGFVFDYSNYEDIRDLYLISDILITDYSSVFFDYSILNRPIIFYAYDLENYRDKLRGFYFNIEEKTPNLIVKTNEELIEKINTIADNEFKPFKEQVNTFKQFCCLEDGHATERVVKEVFSK